MILFFILMSPILINGKIIIDINVQARNNKVDIKCSGDDNKVITDMESNLFNVTTDKLKAGIRIEMGKIPQDVFLKDPTDYGNLFQKYEWEQVKRSLQVHKAKVLDIFNENVVLNAHEFINNSTIEVESKRNMYEEVENYIQSSWYEGGLPNDDINYEVKVNFSYGYFNYTNKWRSNKVYSSKMSFGVSKPGTIFIKPSQTVITSLTASKTILLIELDYKASLRGAVIANYPHTYGKYHFWAPSVQTIMRRADMKNEIFTKELIEIRCFTNPELRVFDKNTGQEVEPPKPKRPKLRILQNKNGRRVIHTRFKAQKKKEN